jgi:hypothetical protein
MLPFCLFPQKRRRPMTQSQSGFSGGRLLVMIVTFDSENVRFCGSPGWFMIVLSMKSPLTTAMIRSPIASSGKEEIERFSEGFRQSEVGNTAVAQVQVTCFRGVLDPRVSLKNVCCQKATDRRKSPGDGFRPDRESPRGKLPFGDRNPTE